MPPDRSRLVAGWEHGEDAAVWEIDENRLGILTVDFITPVVDDPFAFGQIAAANSLSDVFAMGGRPLVALNVVGFPVNCQPLDILKKILRGGQERVMAAGAVLAGGHSVDDEEPKYGLVVYGEVRKDRIWKITGAQPGDVLVLTKPIGTGMIVTAIQAEMDEPGEAEAAVSSMRLLNDLPLKIPEEMFRQVHACTDVTGFGLMGHLLDMLSRGELDAVVDCSKVPVLDGALEKAEMGLVPAGTYRNRELYEPKVEGLDLISQSMGDLLFDAQTSGGLLLAVPESMAELFYKQCPEAGFLRTSIIGRFEKGKGRVKILKGNM